MTSIIELLQIEGIHSDAQFASWCMTRRLKGESRWLSRYAFITFQATMTITHPLTPRWRTQAAISHTTPSTWYALAVSFSGRGKRFAS